MSDDTVKSVYDRLVDIRLHIAGEYAGYFSELLDKFEKTGGDRNSLHILLASLAASRNEFYLDFESGRKTVGSGGPFADNTSYEHSGVAATYDDREKAIILAIAFKYYTDYITPKNDEYIESFEGLYYKGIPMKTQVWTEAIKPLNLAATRGVQILKDDGFDIEYDWDNFYAFLVTSYLDPLKHIEQHTSKKKV